MSKLQKYEDTLPMLRRLKNRYVANKAKFSPASRLKELVVASYKVPSWEQKHSHAWLLKLPKSSFQKM